jgi:hypothetical protein
MLVCAAALTCSLPGIAAAETRETREAYLDRLRDVCSVQCMQPRELLREARKRDWGAARVEEAGDMAGIVDIVDVSRWNDKYLLLTALPQGPQFDFSSQLTPLSQRPVTMPNALVIELDEATFFDLMRVPVPGSAKARGPRVDAEGNIIVERDRDLKFSRPTLNALRDTFRNRRIVVRGTPRLEAVFDGGRVNHAEKKLFLMVDNADDLVLLPRFDENGEPILDDILIPGS